MTPCGSAGHSQHSGALALNFLPLLERSESLALILLFPLASPAFKNSYFHPGPETHAGVLKLKLFWEALVCGIAVLGGGEEKHLIEQFLTTSAYNKALKWLKIICNPIAEEEFLAGTIEELTLIILYKVFWTWKDDSLDFEHHLLLLTLKSVWKLMEEHFLK